MNRTSLLRPVSRSGLALAVALATLTLSACATTASQRTRDQAASAAARDAFVQEQVGKTLASIDGSLQVLVELERGDEGPRRSTALGTTVAGAAGQNRPPVQMAEVAGPKTATGQAREAAAAAALRAKAQQDLATRVRLEWTGQADGLLRELSSRVGFNFAIRGPNRAAPVVQVKHANATVEQVLRDIAHQVDAVADVRVDPAKREVALVYKN